MNIFDKESVLYRNGAWFRSYREKSILQHEKMEALVFDEEDPKTYPNLSMHEAMEIWKEFWTETNIFYHNFYDLPKCFDEKKFRKILKADTSQAGLYALGKHDDLYGGGRNVQKSLENAGDYPLAILAQAQRANVGTQTAYNLYLQAAHLGVPHAIKYLSSDGKGNAQCCRQQALWARAYYHLTLVRGWFDYQIKRNIREAGQFGYWTPHYIVHQCVLECVRKAIFQWLLISRTRMPKDISLLVCAYICTASVWLLNSI